MKTKRISVTAKDIRNGRRRDANRCPVALAIKRAFKTKKVNVCLGVVVNGNNYTYPKKTDEFITSFDLGEKVKPFSFILKEEFDVSLS